MPLSTSLRRWLRFAIHTPLSLPHLDLIIPGEMACFIDRLHPVRKDGVGEIDHASDGECCENCASDGELEGVLLALAFDGVVMSLMCVSGSVQSQAD